MGLNREKWEAIRSDSVFTKENIEELDNYCFELYKFIRTRDSPIILHIKT